MAVHALRPAMGRRPAGSRRGVSGVGLGAAGPHLVTVTVPLPRSLPISSPLRRTAMLVGDLFGAMGVVLLVPFAILAIGLPVVLALRVLLWVVDLF